MFAVVEMVEASVSCPCLVTVVLRVRLLGEDAEDAAAAAVLE